MNEDQDQEEERERRGEQGIWRHTAYIARLLATYGSEDEDTKAHWNELVRMINALIAEVRSVQSLRKDYDRQTRQLAQRTAEAKALQAIAHLEPQGEAAIALRAKLGQVRHHAKLAAQRTEEAQVLLNEAIEGAYQRQLQERNHDDA